MLKGECSDPSVVAGIGRPTRFKSDRTAAYATVVSAVISSTSKRRRLESIQASQATRCRDVEIP